MAKDCNFNTMHPFVTKRVHFSGYWAIVSELNGRKNLIIESLLQWYSSKCNATTWGWFVSLFTVSFFKVWLHFSQFYHKRVQPFEGCTLYNHIFSILAWLILHDKEGPQCISALSMVDSVTSAFVFITVIAFKKLN